MLRVPVLLSGDAYDVVWQLDNLGEHHPALHVRSPGGTLDERARLEREIFEDLAQEGMPLTAVRETLRVLAHAELECYGWIAENQADALPVVAAATAVEYGVIAVNDNGFVRLQPSHGDPADAVAARLPEMPPGRGASINVRQDETGGSGQQAVLLRQLLRRPRTGSAKLYAAHRDRYGRRQRAESFLTTIDVDDGRWLVVRYTDDRRQSWVHATPASRCLVADWLNRLAGSPGHLASSHRW